jgi:hypothetical protein
VKVGKRRCLKSITGYRREQEIRGSEDPVATADDISDMTIKWVVVSYRNDATYVSTGSEYFESAKSASMHTNAKRVSANWPSSSASNSASSPEPSRYLAERGEEKVQASSLGRLTPDIMYFVFVNFNMTGSKKKHTTWMYDGDLVVNLK